MLFFQEGQLKVDNFDLTVFRYISDHMHRIWVNSLSQLHNLLLIIIFNIKHILQFSNSRLQWCSIIWLIWTLSLGQCTTFRAFDKYT